MPIGNRKRPMPVNENVGQAFPPTESDVSLIGRIKKQVETAKNNSQNNNISQSKYKYQSTTIGGVTVSVPQVDTTPPPTQSYGEYNDPQGNGQSGNQGSGGMSSFMDVNTLTEVAVDTAGYSLTNYLTGQKMDVKDTSMYAAADLIYITVGRDFILRKIFPLFGLTDSSTRGEAEFINLAAELIGVIGAHKVLEMFFGEQKSLKDLTMSVGGALVVNKLVDYAILNKK